MLARRLQANLGKISEWNSIKTEGWMLPTSAALFCLRIYIFGSSFLLDLNEIIMNICSVYLFNMECLHDVP